MKRKANIVRSFSFKFKKRRKIYAKVPTSTTASSTMSFFFKKYDLFKDYPYAFNLCCCLNFICFCF